MEVVYDDEDLKTYIEEAVRVSPNHPILVDEFLDYAIELDVDAVADGENVLIGGVMEHVESAGVHSGDSACMIPPGSLGRDTVRRVREVTEQIARSLDVVGLLNVQLAVKDGEIYVLEANPRSSRTVPFVSKATGVPIAKTAAKVMAGNSLDELDVQEQVPEQVSVKEVVLPFDRLPNSDPRLGPEMKSTGEVMGTAESFGKAYWKAQQAAGAVLPEGGTAVIEFEPAERNVIVDLDVSEFEEFYDVKEFDDVPQAIRDGKVDLIISRNREALQAAVEEGVTYYSTAPSVQAALEALRARDEPLDVAPIQDRPRRAEYWGQPRDVRKAVEDLQGVAEAGILDALGLSSGQIAELAGTLADILTVTDDSVMVLAGTDADDAVVDAVERKLHELGYEAHRAEDLAAIDGGPLEQNLPIYLMLSRFSILVGTETGGHLNEVDLATYHDLPLARLVPTGSEYEAAADNALAVEYGDEPGEAVSTAVTWAEGWVERRRTKYGEKYSWRGGESS